MRLGLACLDTWPALPRVLSWGTERTLGTRSQRSVSPIFIELCMESHVCTLRRGTNIAAVRVVQGYSRVAWLADLIFFVTREFRKLFFVIRDPKVLRDPWRTWIINRYSWFYHSILRDFQTRVPWMVRTVLAIEDFFFFKRSFWCKSTEVIEKNILLAYFCESKIYIFVIRDPPFFRSWTVPETPPERPSSLSFAIEMKHCHSRAPTHWNK